MSREFQTLEQRVLSRTIYRKHVQASYVNKRIFHCVLRYCASSVGGDLKTAIQLLFIF